MVKKIIFSAIGLAVGVVLLIIGAGGLSKLLKEGHLVANYTSYVPWGLGVSWYVYLVWLEVGTLLSFVLLVYIFGMKQLKSIGTVIYLSGLLILTAAILTIVMDIGRIEKAFDIIFKPHFSSMITWMVWMHVAYSVVLALELIVSLFSNKGVKGADTIGAVLGWISIPVGIVLISVIGAVFGVVAGEPFWKSSALSFGFLLSSLVAGGAFLNIMYIAFSPDKETDLYNETTRLLGKAILIFMALSTIGAAVTLTGIRYPEIDIATPITIYFSGIYEATWALILGLVIPAVILLVQSIINIPRNWYAVALASILIVIALWVVPLNIIVNPQLIEPLPGLAEAFPHERLTFTYTPSGTEWAINMLPLGIAVLGFTIGYWILNLISPMKPTAEKEV